MDRKNRGKKYIAVLNFGTQKGCNEGWVRHWGDYGFSRYVSGGFKQLFQRAFFLISKTNNPTH